MNFITHFLSPEQDLCTSTSALRILPSLPPPSLSFSSALWLPRHLFRPVCVWKARLCKDHCLALEAKWPRPPTRLPQLRYTWASGRGKSELQLCFLCIGAFFKQRIIKLHGMGVNSKDSGGRCGADSWLCQLTSCANNLSLSCPCVLKGE